MIDAGEFDYVIAGGGTAGCVVAARLSEDPNVSVCLLEAGPSDVDDPRILRLEDWMYLLDSGYDWDYLIEPQARGNSFLRHARAKVLGGCSSHNSCIAFWTPKEDLDEWAAMGNEGWSSADCWPLIKRLETNDGPGDHHGRHGPVNIRTVPPDDPCGVAILEAAAQAGLPTSRFNEGHTVTNGAGWFQINSSADNTRMSSSHAYLHPILGTRPNLELRVGCWVNRVELEDGRACAVEYLTPDLLTHGSVRARREVILSAGSIDTPKLLMLSGIGPGEHLHEFGIQTLVHSPGVGANLDDHVEGIVQWDAKKPMIRTSTQWWEIGLFSTSEEGLDRPDLMMHYGSVPFDMNTARWGYPTTENGFCLTPNVCRGRSRGTVRLRSSDFRDRARVDRTRARSRGPDRRRADRLHAQDAQHRLSPGVQLPHGPGLGSARGRGLAPARAWRSLAADRGRLDPPVPAGDQPVHHYDDDRRKVRRHAQGGCRPRRRGRGAGSGRLVVV